MSSPPPSAGGRVRRSGGARVRKAPSDPAASSEQEEERTPKRVKLDAAPTSSARRAPILHELSVNILTLPSRPDGAVQLVEGVVLPGCAKQELKDLRLGTFWELVTARMPHVGPATHAIIAPVNQESEQRWRFVDKSQHGDALLFSSKDDDGLKLGRTKVVQVHVLALANVQVQNDALTDARIDHVRTHLLASSCAQPAATSAAVGPMLVSICESRDLFFTNPPPEWHHARVHRFMDRVMAEPQTFAIAPVMMAWVTAADVVADEKPLLRSFLVHIRRSWFEVMTEILFRDKQKFLPLFAYGYASDGFVLGELLEYLTCAVEMYQREGLAPEESKQVEVVMVRLMEFISNTMQDSPTLDPDSVLNLQEVAHKAICMQALSLLPGNWFQFWQGQLLPWLFAMPEWKRLRKQNAMPSALRVGAPELKQFVHEDAVCELSCTMMASLLIRSPSDKNWFERVRTILRSLDYVCSQAGWKSIMEVFDFFFRCDPFLLALAMNTAGVRSLCAQFNPSNNTLPHPSADAFRNPADKIEEDAAVMRQHQLGHTQVSPITDKAALHPWTMCWLASVNKIAQRPDANLSEPHSLCNRLMECAVALFSYSDFSYTDQPNFAARAPHLASYWRYRSLRPDACIDVPASCTRVIDLGACVDVPAASCMIQYRSSILNSVAQQVQSFIPILDTILAGLSHRCRNEFALRRIELQRVVKFDIDDEVRIAAGLRDTYAAKLIFAVIPAWYRSLEKMKEPSLPSTIMLQQQTDVMLETHSFLLNVFLRLYPAAWHLDWQFLRTTSTAAATLGWHVKQTTLDNRFVHLTRQGLLEPRPPMFRQAVDAWRWKCAEQPRGVVAVDALPPPPPLLQRRHRPVASAVVLQDEDDIPDRVDEEDLSILRRRDMLPMDADASAPAPGTEVCGLHLEYPKLPPQRAVVISRNASPVLLMITRSSLLDSSMAALMNLTFRDLQGGFEVRFHGSFEDGEGFGVLQEWVSLLSEYIFTQAECWLPSEYDARTFVFNHAQPNPVIFALAGKLHALALLTRTKLKYSLASHLLRFAMTGVCDWRDLRFLNQDNYNSIKSLFEMEDVSVTGLTFVIPAENATEVDVELKPGGADHELTNENRDEFAALYAQTIMVDKHTDSLQTFTKAFGTLLNIKTFPHTLFSNHDLVRVWCGEAVTDIELLRHKTQYTEYDPARDACISWFWEVFADMTEADRQKLLFFTTSSAQVMLHAKPVFRIQRACKDDNARPTGQTCFRTLLLPEYSSKQVLRQHLEWIVACPSRYLSFGNV